MIIRERYNGSGGAVGGEHQAGGQHQAAGNPDASTDGTGGAVLSGSDTEGEVVDVQVEGTWSGGNGGMFPSLPTPVGSRTQPRTMFDASPLRKQDKKTLRSNA